MKKKLKKNLEKILAHLRKYAGDNELFIGIRDDAVKRDLTIMTYLTTSLHGTANAYAGNLRLQLPLLMVYNNPDLSEKNKIKIFKDVIDIASFFLTVQQHNDIISLVKRDFLGVEIEYFTVRSHDFVSSAKNVEIEYLAQRCFFGFITEDSRGRTSSAASDPKPK